MKEVNIQELGAAWFSLAKDHAKLFFLESELAQISMIPLLISAVALLLFTITLWCLLLAIIGAGFYWMGYSLLFTLLLVFLFNLILCCFAIVSIQRYKSRISFARTRESVRELLE